MEALAARIAAFCLQKHYIEPDQIAWLQYGLMRRLMGMVLLIKILNIRTKGVIIMASKETFTQHLAHEMAQAVVHRERYGWPPDSQWGMFQPTRPEEMKKPAAKEDH